jgi:hypothetical protein
MSHFVQLVVPFALFAPQPVATIAGACIAVHQFWLVVSGNYAWLNWLTIVLAASAVGTPWPAAAPVHAVPAAYDVFLLLLAGATAAMSIPPVLNLMSKDQAMNRSYNPVHLVCTYGAFGRVTRERFEVVLEATESEDPRSDEARWLEYEWKGKPGPVGRMPPQVAPYHLRLDWLLWFLPFSARVRRGEVFVPGHAEWFVRLVERLLEADAVTLRLLRVDPLHGCAPQFVRARYYRYQYTDWGERRRTGAWWKRTLVGEYLPATSLADARRQLC